MSDDVFDDPLRAVRECAFRQPLAEPDSEFASCGVLSLLAGPDPLIESRVAIDICAACRSAMAGGAPQRNPVIASRLHELTTHARLEPRDESQVADLRLLREYARRNLECRTPLGGAEDDAQCEPTARFVDRAPRHRRAALRWPKLCMIGLNTPTGLGHQCQGIVENVPGLRWLIPATSGPQLPPAKGMARRIHELPPLPTEEELRRRLQPCDWLLFVETPVFPEMTKLAKRMGKKVACVCNWEWTCPVTLDWLRDVDLMICPTSWTYEVMQSWRKRFGFGWQMLLLSWPIHWQRFRFRPRRTCRRFVFVNGTGGCRARRLDESLTPYRRKGAEVLFEAARLVPSIPIIVYSQTSDLPPVPSNVEVRRPPADNRRLYDEGDVCLQPSHWEGLGLPLLECQVAGMPLLTTDAPPMNEHNPVDCFAVDKTDVVTLQGVAPVRANIMLPEAIAEKLERWFQRDITQASVDASRYVRKHHGWKKAKGILKRALHSTDPSYDGESDADAVF